ncbi:hypothetical protein [Chitinivorax sp. B]|uniref:hypothetical protein n=1 Tax=Chitinivorax sp. B TaxID=2502235 RepID=UPI0010F58AAC|nr:hypothetical protein [Chitinivorax sp. B]
MIQEFHHQLRTEATQLAGNLNSLSQRAAVYHHLYADSGGNNVFPLIAAHGALWAAGYFKQGMLVAHALSFRHVLSPEIRQSKLHHLADFANAFRDINRRVCIEAYTAYHLTKQFGMCTYTRKVVPLPLLMALSDCHLANRHGRQLSQAGRARLFTAFFLWEQDAIVDTAVKQAYARFDWPIIKRMALRPNINFAYFPRRGDFKFSDFSNKQERIQKGLRAYQVSEAVGLDKVEQALLDYPISPAGLTPRYRQQGDFSRDALVRNFCTPILR